MIGYVAHARGNWFKQLGTGLYLEALPHRTEYLKIVMDDWMKLGYQDLDITWAAHVRSSEDSRAREIDGQTRVRIFRMRYEGRSLGRGARQRERETEEKE